MLRYAPYCRSYVDFPPVAVGTIVDVSTTTDIYGAYLEDSWHPTAKLVVNGGLRYDLDTNGNNSGFTHPLVPKGLALFGSTGLRVNALTQNERARASERSMRSAR